MLSNSELTRPDVIAYCQKLREEAESSGYHLNPDLDFTYALIEGLILNTERYGYPACPCRLAEGVADQDRDIVCPCDYRDPDLHDYDSCYCALYVSDKVSAGARTAQSIPERRVQAQQNKAQAIAAASQEIKQTLPYPVWRCAVCGYLCARENPPEVCPICKVKKERFERFL